MTSGIAPNEQSRSQQEYAAHDQTHPKLTLNDSAHALTIRYPAGSANPTSGNQKFRKSRTIMGSIETKKLSLSTGDPSLASR